MKEVTNYNWTMRLTEALLVLMQRWDRAIRTMLRCRERKGRLCSRNSPWRNGREEEEEEEDGEKVL
jgi:hypothetical protein